MVAGEFRRKFRGVLQVLRDDVFSEGASTVARASFG